MFHKKEFKGRYALLKKWFEQQTESGMYVSIPINHNGLHHLKHDKDLQRLLRRKVIKSFNIYGGLWIGYTSLTYLTLNHKDNIINRSKHYYH